jgi:hypothetical protein
MVDGIAGTIDEGAKTISAEVPNGTDLTSLSPTIVISDKATISPASGASQDFTNPVTFTVTAEDGSSVGYIVTITVESSLSSAKAITDFMVDGITGTIDEAAKTIAVVVPTGTDLTSLSPTITISAFAAVNPASGAAQDFTDPVVYTVTAEDGTSVGYTVTLTEPCVSDDSIYEFTYDGKMYEVVRQNRTWEGAAACAVERGGYLAEINDEAENAAIFDELINNASIDISMTKSSDGGGASYVWIGGNDIEIEGTWIWDGNNDGTATQFWMGDINGGPVDGLYNNWGNEPDDFMDGPDGTEQDGLGLALTEWPIGSGTLGVAGQWNDVSYINILYYVIEYD